MSLWPSKTKMWQAKTRVTSVPVKKTNNGIRYSEEIVDRSEEHTSELQSRSDLVCRLLLEKKKKKKVIIQCQDPCHREHQTTTDDVITDSEVDIHQIHEISYNVRTTTSLDANSSSQSQSR